MKTYNKLVRDKIPEIMLASGVKPVTKTLNPEEYTLFLEKKLDEEVAEYHKDKNVEELADILEVGLGKRKPEDMEMILAAMNREAAGMTAPPEGLFLVKVEYE